MAKVLVPVRDLTDSDQNQAVLDAASALVGGRATPGQVAASLGPAVAPEASAAARSRRRLEPAAITLIVRAVARPGGSVASSLVS
jgi:hypothetical protein